MARKMSARRDHMLDRKAGIKEGSARDNRLDRERGVTDAGTRRAARMKKGRK